MNPLGIYFGPRIISIVETKGKILLNHIQIAQATISTSELEEKVPSEVKTVALFKDELRRNKIESTEAILVLSGKDLVIRTFEMPVVPSNELENAAKFEAKKYIPFKIEDLITDFQAKYDKASRKNIVLFVGIKKEILERYLSILSQLDIRPNVIEYSAFSVLRLLRLSNFSDKGIISVVNVDFQEEDEVNFTVLENSFPLFSRDITLTGVLEDSSGAKEKDSGIILEKLKTEIRVSLDYYNRKFPSKKITKVFFLSSQAYHSDLEVFITDMGLAFQFIDAAKFLGETTPFSLSIVKGYCASLLKIVKSDLKVNLITAKEKTEKKEKSPVSIEMLPSLFTGLQIYPNVVILGILICLATFAFGIINRQPLMKEINGIISMQQKIQGLSSNLSNEELSKVDSEYKQRVKIFDDLVGGQLYLTKILEIIARVKPDGIWIDDFNFKKENNKSEFVLTGMAYLTDSDKEFTLVNKFLSSLRDNSVFAKYFKDFTIASLEHRQFKNATVTTFTIVCRSSKGER